MKKILYLALISASAMAFYTGCKSTPAVEETCDEEWELVWEDNFDSVGYLDTTVWSKIPRGVSSWSKHMTDADTCYDITDGNLILRGLKADGIVNDTVPYITGGVFTKGKKAFQEGRLEVRAKLHGAKGAWPAIWMSPDPAFSKGDSKSYQWPYGGEIDVMERLNHDPIAYQTVHSYYTVDLKQDTVPPHSATGVIYPDEYNVYAIEMYPDSMRFFINDIHTLTYPRIETPLEGQYPFDRPFYLLIDIQLGGNWVGEIDPTELPATMYVDRVSFYRRKHSDK